MQAANTSTGSSVLFVQNDAPPAKRKKKKGRRTARPLDCSAAGAPPFRRPSSAPLAVPPPREPAPSFPLFCGASSRPAFSSPRRRPLDPSSSRPRRRQVAAAARIEGGRILSEKDGAFWLQQRKYGAFYQLALFQPCPFLVRFLHEEVVGAPAAT